MAAAKQEATESVTALHAALSTCEAFKQQREDESKEKAKLIALLTAKDILNAGKEDLERGAEMLSAGLHETTIACSRCQRQPQTCVDPGPYVCCDLDSQSERKCWKDIDVDRRNDRKAPVHSSNPGSSGLRDGRQQYNHAAL
eukprot:Selendium_serpulae@DN5880_c0_g1_i10.p2